MKKKSPTEKHSSKNDICGVINRTAYCMKTLEALLHRIIHTRVNKNDLYLFLYNLNVCKILQKRK